MFPFVYKINFAGWFHLVYFGIVVPLAAVLAARKFRKSPLPDRLKNFKAMVVTLTSFGVISLLCALVNPVYLFPRVMPSWRAILAGLVMYLLAVAAMRPYWRAAVEKRARVVHLYMPANATERMWWIIVAILAGVIEEITWRGVQTGLAVNFFGSVWLGILFCVVSFAVAHAVQGWKSAAIISVFAVGFHALVWLSGSLYVAMAVHILYDVTAGISYGRLGERSGYTPEASNDVPAPV